MQQIALLGGVPQSCAPPGAPKGVAERVGRLGGSLSFKSGATRKCGRGKPKLPGLGRGGCLCIEARETNYGTEDKERQTGGRERQRENGGPTSP